jgi:PAS domain S-box-containing protein
MVIVNDQGVIVLVNAMTLTLFGYNREELLGESLEILISVAARKRHASLREGYFANPHTRKMDGGTNLYGRRKDGSEFPIEVSLSPMDTKNGRLISSAIRDITDRRRIEAELLTAKAVAENANRAKSDFLSSMSHELRSPLNAILGFAQLLEADSPPPSPSQKSSIDQILQAGWYLLELINEILDLALIESGKLSVSLEPIDLSEIMTDCQAMIEPHIKNSVTLSFPLFTEPCLVKADRTRIKQVLLNLLSNAIKYNRVGGRVDVKLTPCTTDVIRISVHDTGESLSPEKLSELFQPFNRLGQEKCDKEGTGIGLVMSKRLVELMGGTIGVESTLGEGSVFWFELFRETSQQQAKAAELPCVVAVELPTTFTLLYVEDNPANLMLVEKIVAAYPNITMLSAESGKRGIALARSHLPDIILMDINLPGICGIEALRMLRADPATASIPVIALSANAMVKDIENGLQAGFFRYLTKPIKINEFMNALNDVMTSSTASLSYTNGPSS